MPKTTTLTDRDQVATLREANEQAARQIDSLQERVRELGAFQREALDGRETIETLAADNEVLTSSLAQARREIGELRSALESALVTERGNNELVVAAENLSSALRVFLK